MYRSQRTLAKRPAFFVTVIKGLLGGALLVGLAGNLAPAWAQDELFVTNQDNNSVTVYVRTADGDISPLRTLSGADTGLSDPSGLFADPVGKELFVANAGNDTVTVYPLIWPVLEPNIKPIRSLSGVVTGGLDTPTGLTVDTVNKELFVANLGNDSVTVYPQTWPVMAPNTPFLRSLIRAGKYEVS
jgi:DNA-binding beta-propeller fold protein YncE